MIQAIGKVINGRVMIITTCNGSVIGTVKPLTRPVHVPVVNTATVTVATVIEALDVPAFMQQRTKDMRAQKRLSRIFKAH